MLTQDKTLAHVVEEEEALEGFFHKLSNINGYKAAIIMTYTGGMLAAHSADPSVDLMVVGKTFNDIFRSAHDASEKIGMQCCHETTIKTPNGIVIMRCPGVNSMVHFHVLAIFANDGNYALAKMEIEKMIPQILKHLLQQ